MICRRLDSIPTNPVQGDNLEDGSGTVGNHLSSGLPHLVCSLGLSFNRGDLGLEEQTCQKHNKKHGMWRSLVAHLLWEQGVAGSNPAIPTIQARERLVLRVTTRG